MKLNDKSNELIKEITPTRIRKYLLGTGWEEESIKFGSVTMFHRKDDSETQILLPIKTDFLDYVRRVRELIEHLSTIEARNEVEIFNELLLPVSDIIRFRIDNKETKGGNIPIMDGINLLPSVKQMLYASAMSLKKPNTYFKMLKDKDVEKFINSCMLGQTERGSFVASIICPIDSQMSVVMDKRADNFGRETVLNLMTSLNKITTSIDKNATEGTIDKSVKSAEFNYNFCNALMELRPEDKDSDISISVVWAPEDKPKVPTPSQVIVRKYHYEQLPKIVERIRPKDKPIHEEFVGKVSALVGQEDKSEKLILGDVILSIIGRDDRIIKAKVFLNRTDYERACDAHKKNKAISIKGELQWGERIRRLEKYSSFKVMD